MVWKFQKGRGKWLKVTSMGFYFPPLYPAEAGGQSADIRQSQLPILAKIGQPQFKRLGLLGRDGLNDAKNAL